MGDFWLHSAPIGQGLPQDSKGGPGGNGELSQA